VVGVPHNHGSNNQENCIFGSPEGAPSSNLGCSTGIKENDQTSKSPDNQPSQSFWGLSSLLWLVGHTTSVALDEGFNQVDRFEA